MPIEIVQSSPKANDIAKNPDSTAHNKRNSYPFEKLEVGQSFTIPKAEAKVNSLKVIASRKSKDGKEYRVIEHDKPAVIEVARIK